MRKDRLKTVVDVHIEKTRNALQTVYDALNSGQQKKIIKNAEVKRLFDVYGVKY